MSKHVTLNVLYSAVYYSAVGLTIEIPLTVSVPIYPIVYDYSQLSSTQKLDLYNYKTLADVWYHLQPSAPIYEIQLTLLDSIKNKIYIKSSEIRYVTVHEYNTYNNGVICSLANNKVYIDKELEIIYLGLWLPKPHMHKLYQKFLSLSTKVVQIDSLEKTFIDKDLHLYNLYIT